MKLKLSQIKPNPFHDGKFDEEQISNLMSSIGSFQEKKGFIGSLPVIQNGKDYTLVFGHHRKKALETLYGRNYQVEVTLQPKLSDEDLLRAKVNENLTQRKDPKAIINELVSVRNYLKNTTPVVIHNRRDKLGRKNHDIEVGSVRHIEQWLKGDSNKPVMFYPEISSFLRIHDNLAPELYAKLEKGEANKVEYDDEGELKEKVTDAINITNAIILSQFKDKAEQKDIHKALQQSRDERAYRVRTRGKLVSAYKKADSQTKKLIREGKKDIADAMFANIPEEKAYKISDEEYCIKLREQFNTLTHEIDFWEKQVSKDVSPRQTNMMLEYLKAWTKNTFAPFVLRLSEKANKNSIKVTFDNDSNI